jgi:hypothetical protein
MMEFLQTLYVDLGVILVAPAILKSNINNYIKGLWLVLSFDCFFTIQNYFFDIEMFTWIGFFEIILISYYLFCKIISFNIKTINSCEELDKEYLYYLGRRPQKLMEWLRNIHTVNICSSGIMAYSNMWDSFQMRKKFDTLQKIPRYTKGMSQLFKDYYIIKTDIKKVDLDLKFPNWEEVLLQQKARNWNTLFRRTNCFKSLRPILNKKYSKKFIFRFWFLPWSSELNWVIWKIKGII